MEKAERNRLVLDNLPLVGYLVSDLCARATHLSREDLASVGALGLVLAASRSTPRWEFRSGRTPVAASTARSSTRLALARLGRPRHPAAHQVPPGHERDARRAAGAGAVP